METRVSGQSQENGLHRRETLSSPGLSVYVVQGQLREPSTTRQDVTEGNNLLSVGLSGTVVYSESSTKRNVRVLPSPGALYASGPTVARMHYARGTHDRLEFEWRSNDFVALDDWIRGTVKNHDISGVVAGANLRTVAAHYSHLFTKLHQGAQSGNRNAVPSMFAAISEFVGKTVTTSSVSVLAVIPEEVPDSLRILMEKVKENPTHSWSLKEAAGHAGYSPFHLSRTFRTVLAYGFPEFVDRCRTELAIERLLRENVAIDDLSDSCGFGSTQALRESFKEYIGLLPSELRTLISNENVY